MSPLFDRSIEAAEQTVKYLEDVEVKNDEKIGAAVEYLEPLGKIFAEQAEEDAFNAAQKGKLKNLADRIPKVVEKHRAEPVPADSRAVRP